MNLRCWVMREAVYLRRVRRGPGLARLRIYSSHATRPTEIIGNVATWPVHYAARRSQRASAASSSSTWPPRAAASHAPAHLTLASAAGDCIITMRSFLNLSLQIHVSDWCWCSVCVLMSHGFRAVWSSESRYFLINFFTGHLCRLQKAFFMVDSCQKILITHTKAIL